MSKKYLCLKTSSLNPVGYLYYPEGASYETTKLLSAPTWTDLATADNLQEYHYVNNDYPDWSGPLYITTVGEDNITPTYVGPLVGGEKIELWEVERYVAGDIIKEDATSTSSIKFGGTDVSKIYFGSTEVSKVYLGSIEVYSSSITPTPEPTEKRLFAYSFDQEEPNFIIDGATSTSTSLWGTDKLKADYRYDGQFSLLMSTVGNFDLTLPNIAEPDSYTVEFWFQYEQFMNTYRTSGCLLASCAQGSDGNYNGFEIWTQDNGSLRYNITKNSTSAVGGGMVYLSGDTSNTRNGWVHVCIVKASTGAFYGGLQGKLVLINAENQCGWQQLIRFGKAIRTSSAGRSYMDCATVSKTNTLKDFNAEALTYTLPDAPQTKTMFLSHFESTDDFATDLYTTFTNGEGYSSVGSSTSYHKFGNASMETAYPNKNLTITTTNSEPDEYTVECWIHPMQNAPRFIVGSCAQGSDGNYSGFEIWTQDSGKIRYNITNNAGAVDGGMVYSEVAAINMWHHIALVKSKQGVFGAMDGKLVLVNSDTTKLGWKNVISLGKALRSNSLLSYPVDDFRITKYNSLKDFDATNLTYTVPTEAFNWE